MTRLDAKYFDDVKLRPDGTISLEVFYLDDKGDKYYTTLDAAKIYNRLKNYFKDTEYG